MDMSVPSEKLVPKCISMEQIVFHMMGTLLTSSEEKRKRHLSGHLTKFASRTPMLNATVLASDTFSSMGRVNNLLMRLLIGTAC